MIELDFHACRNFWAEVDSFEGIIRIMNIDKLVFVEGRLDRVYGDGYKFKMDEEPFLIRAKK